MPKDKPIMTIEVAIRHCYEVYHERDDMCKECREEHLQLAKWLEEYKKYESIKSTVNEFWEGLQKLSMFKGKEKPTLEELLEYIEQVKAEAVTEFVMNLPMTPGIFHFLDERNTRANTVVVFVHDIDRLAEKMTGNKFRQCKAEYYKKIDHNSLCETETYEGNL